MVLSLNASVLFPSGQRALITPSGLLRLRGGPDRPNDQPYDRYDHQPADDGDHRKAACRDTQFTNLARRGYTRTERSTR